MHVRVVVQKAKKGIKMLVTELYNPEAEGHTLRDQNKNHKQLEQGKMK